LIGSNVAWFPSQVIETSNQMNGLYPIIRRVRRPLLPPEVPADQVPSDRQKADAKPAAPVVTQVEATKEAAKKDGKAAQIQK
jgi:hypothetical protein